MTENMKEGRVEKQRELELEQIGGITKITDPQGHQGYTY